MSFTQEEQLNDIYNLILTSGTREWERTQLVSAKNALEDGADFSAELSKLEANLRPLAVRNNLTPDVAEFYLRLTGESVNEAADNRVVHSGDDPVYQERAIFAGGCFWCMVEPFETMAGIVSVLSGYTGGHVAHPSYDQVSGGYTGHVEAVEIIFDTRIITYEELVALYWQITDPTDAFGQFQDRGSQYRPIIFVQDERQRQIAEDSKQQLIESGKYKQPIVTEIQTAETFWPAENYHQQFYKKQPKRYKQIKRSRQQFLTYQHLKGKVRTVLNKHKKTF
ncbi:peptide-methionine (S)-S-oxide reductase MsrA [Enterococcus larvae]|uniref:peptide-methionine (S)-S-oxide reductase MsrA n=1 Tax=Enterococcus larvae TaxID=2794352 RepID=UPI003F3D24A7